MERLTKELRQQAIDEIRDYVETELGQEMGELGAGNFLDFIQERLAWTFYNQGIRDAEALLVRYQSSLADDLGAQQMLPPR